MLYIDKTLFSFGKHQGKKLANVPAEYLLWCRANIKNLGLGLKRYIDDNMDALKKEMNKN